MISIIIFILITIFLVIKLGEVLGMRIGYRVDIKHEGYFSKDTQVEEVQPEKSDLDSKIRNISGVYNSFNVLNFTEKAKKAFEIIFEAYAANDKRTLKNLLTPRLYDAFVLAIDDRISRKEVLEGVLVRFIKYEIIDANLSERDIFVKVKFVTEQSNVLKSGNGSVIEGNSDFIENRTDVWTFSRKKTSTDQMWYVYEIKDTDDI
jgi:predicted lipid-binding transport protein (Tim44 family)